MRDMASDIIIQDKHREEGLNNRGVGGLTYRLVILEEAQR